MTVHKPTFDRPPVLLPLLRAPSTAPNALAPPLDSLPGGSVGPSRIILEQPAPSAHKDPRSAATWIPSGSRSSPTTWISTNHVFPAAYPRSHAACTAPSSTPTPPPLPLPSQVEGARKEEHRRREESLAEWNRRKEMYGKEVEALEPPTSDEEAERIARRLAAQALPQLWATIQRIVPLSDDEGLARRSSEEEEEEGNFTLFFAHANGFHKETWEQTIRVLLQTLSASTSAARIDEIWSLDTMASGESGPLNRDSLGDLVSWFDGARDIIQFLDHYLPSPEETTSQQGRGCARPATFGPQWLPTVLKAPAKVEVPSPGPHGKRKRRRIVAIGHSYSGGALSCAAGVRPDLFDGLIMLDPVLLHPDRRAEWLREGKGPLDQPLAQGAVVRKDVWTDQRDALSYLASRPFFARWDRQVLSSYARFGTSPLSTSPSSLPGRTLSMSRWSEAAYFATTLLQSPFTLAALRSQRFKGKIHHFTMDTQSVQTDKDTKTINDVIAIVGGTFETLKGGHLVVQEQPGLVGRKLAEVIQRWHGGPMDTYHPPQPRL